jgi:tRNA threonylcarbamoyladenosine biosynthesis protein TsaB
MIVLALDTSTAQGTVALRRDGELLLEANFPADRSQSSELFPILQRAVELAPRMDRIAIGLGPGSYAGARIAIAAALGLSCAVGAELIGLASVAALAGAPGHYVVIGDARRETFYFTVVEGGICTEGPLLLAADMLRERLAQNVLPVYATAAIPGFPQATVALPSAAVLAAAAAEGRGILQRGDLEPLYLREPHITTPKVRAI